MNEIVTQDGTQTELAAPQSFGSGMSFVNPEDMPDLDAAEVGISIQPTYYEFTTVGQSIRAVFNGMGHITKRLEDDTYKDIPAVVLQTKDGVLLNAGASLVNQFQTLPQGTAVQVTFKGEEKTKGGQKVKTYEVRILNVKVKTQVVTAPVVQSPAAPTSAEPQFKNTEYSTRFWEQANALRLTPAEGLAHLAEFGYDMKAALDALEEPA